MSEGENPCALCELDLHMTPAGAAHTINVFRIKTTGSRIDGNVFCNVFWYDPAPQTKAT